MAIQVQGNSGVTAEVGGTSVRALNTHGKPIEYQALGHYRIALRINSTAAQAANSKLLELRNPSTNLIIPTRLTLRAMQTVAGTAQENSIDVFKVTSFTVLDTTNTVTPVPVVKRTTAMPAGASAQAQIRHLTLAGAAAGMTGGTMTKDANALSTFPYMVSAAAATGTTGQWGPYEVFDDVNGTHPLVLLQNEGIILENRVLNVTTYGITWYLDFCWAECTSY